MLSVMSRGSKSTTHVVAGKLQREALGSPLRIEIIGFFEYGGMLSVRDIAERLGRPVASMYFHVHKLVRAGLLVEGPKRGTGPAAEVLYRAVADRIALQVNPRSPASVDAVVRSVRALLRQAGREFESACRSSSHWAAESGQDAAGRRQRAWLTAEDAAEARRRLDGVERFLASRSRKSGGSEHTWTSLLIPVATSRRSVGKKKNGEKK